MNRFFDTICLTLVHPLSTKKSRLSKHSCNNSINAIASKEALGGSDGRSALNGKKINRLSKCWVGNISRLLLFCLLSLSSLLLFLHLPRICFLLTLHIVPRDGLWPERAFRPATLVVCRQAVASRHVLDAEDKGSTHSEHCSTTRSPRPARAGHWRERPSWPPLRPGTRHQSTVGRCRPRSRLSAVVRTRGRL